jgi:tRNA(fMet)-specific endonuclease VapC
MRVLLDTNVLVNILRRPAGKLAERVARVAPGSRATASVCIAELLYGAARSSREADERLLIEGVIVPQIVVLSFDLAAAREYGRLRLSLERQGRPIEESDLQIASIALAHDLTLITGNVKHFSHVPGLRVEDWTE